MQNAIYQKVMQYRDKPTPCCENSRVAFCNHASRNLYNKRQISLFLMAYHEKNQVIFLFPVHVEINYEIEISFCQCGVFTDSL